MGPRFQRPPFVATSEDAIRGIYPENRGDEPPFGKQNLNLLSGDVAAPDFEDRCLVPFDLKPFSFEAQGRLKVNRAIEDVFRVALPQATPR